MKKTGTSLVQFWVTTYITSEFNVCRNLRILFIKKGIIFLLVQIWTIIYMTSEFSLMKKTEGLLAQF